MSLLPSAPSPSGLPIKLKLTLGRVGSPAQAPIQPDNSDTSLNPVASSSSLAPTSTPSQFGPYSSLPSVPSFGQTPSSSGFNSPALGQPSGVSSPAALDSNGQPIKKRRRAPKKGPGEVVQPGGKGWRKGVKGIIVAGQPLPPRDPNVAVVINNGPPTNSFRGFTAAQSTGSTKTPAGYLAPQTLDKNTPKPREWSLGLCEFASITGKALKFKSWKGASESPYRLAVHPAPPPQAQSQSDLDLVGPTPSAPASAQPHPLSNPTFPVNPPSTSASVSSEPSRLPSQEPSPAPAQVLAPASVPVVEAMEGVEQA